MNTGGKQKSAPGRFLFHTCCAEASPSGQGPAQEAHARAPARPRRKPPARGFADRHRRSRPTPNISWPPPSSSSRGEPGRRCPARAGAQREPGPMRRPGRKARSTRMQGERGQLATIKAHVHVTFCCFQSDFSPAIRSAQVRAVGRRDYLSPSCS